jgi:predicted ATPase
VLINNAQMFVISGGPGAGKTTLLAELQKLGYSTAPEVARKIIQEQVQTGGDALPWLDKEAFTLLMLQRSIESYLANAILPGPSFSDRGIPDALCYARLIGLAAESILDACREYRYARLVFLAPPWKEIYTTDEERKQDFAEAARTFENMAEVYEECGYESVILPKTDPAARAQFVLQTINCAEHKL